jgi:hypothetical protein
MRRPKNFIVVDVRQREHGRRQCPAFGKQCRRCGAFGHFSRVCPKRNKENKQPRVNTIDDDEQDEGEYLLHCFEFFDVENDWFEEMKLAWQAVVFQLEIGA